MRLVVVTGSFARGDHDELSDLDIELYVRETHPLLEETAWFERFGEVLVTEALENPDGIRRGSSTTWTGRSTS